jgi:hydroxypyruvate reductase
MDTSPREFLETLFRTAVAAAHPASWLAPHLSPPPAGKGR